MDMELVDFKPLISSVLVLCMTALGYFLVSRYRSTKRKNRVKPLIVVPQKLPELKDIRLTLDELMGYDGTRSDGRILVALKGVIYDVSSDSLEFGLGGTLSHVAGSDFTHYLSRIMEFNDTEIDYVERWKAILETNYTRVGILVDESGISLVETTNLQYPENSNESGDPLLETTDAMTQKDNILEQLIGSAIDQNENLQDETPDAIPQEYLRDTNSEHLIVSEICDSE